MFVYLVGFRIMRSCSNIKATDLDEVLLIVALDISVIHRVVDVNSRNPDAIRRHYQRPGSVVRLIEF